jgi:eukaryotic-like serine/threonine-protein kinase
VTALKVCPQCGTEYPANARFCEIDGTALRSAAGDSDLLGTIVADRYHVLKKLGEGGMGQVYLAEHVKMGRKSALKVMHAGMKADVDAVSRFNREAANASRISHPNVAAVYDFGETPDGVIYLAMEYIDGAPLTEVVATEGPLEPRRAAEIVRQTAEALAVAHDMGIVHRDLKPDNIMIAKNRDGSDCVKVVDFGIAKAAGNASQKVTKTGLVVGTPEYMSPEQLSGDKLDGRSDLYSLAIVAFNMLTGKLPFPGETSQESMIMRLTDPPKSLAEMRPEVAWTAEVQAVMEKALQRDASRRYQTAIEFGIALYTAIDRMSDAKAPAAIAAANAPAIDALPSTRVAGNAPAGNGPAVPVSEPPIPAGVQRTATGGSGRKLGMIGGGVAALAIAGVIAFKMFGHSAPVQPSPAGDTAAVRDSATSISPIAQTPPAQTQPPQTPAAPTPTKTPASTSTSGNGSSPNQGSRVSGQSVAEQLRGLIDASRNPARGAVVLSTVQALQLKSDEEVYLGASLRANVAAAKLDTAGACKALGDVLPKLSGDWRDRAEDRRKNALMCPQ